MYVLSNILKCVLTHSIYITRTHEHIHHGMTRQSTYPGEPLYMTSQGKFLYFSRLFVGVIWGVNEPIFYNYMDIFNQTFHKHATIHTCTIHILACIILYCCTCVGVSKRVCSLDQSSQDAQTYAGRPHTRCYRRKAKRLGT